MKRYLVYKATNLVNGKLYIGITSKPTIGRRWNEHVAIALGKKCNSPKKYFQRAIAKYGPENFKTEQIDEAMGLEAALEKEKDYILALGTLDSDVGYNLIAYSFNGVNYVSDQTRQKQSVNSHVRTSSSRAGLDTSPKRPNKFISHISKDRKHYRKAFPTALEALEGRDKMALYLYGDHAKLNFPSKREEYLEEDLEQFFRWYSEKKRIHNTGVTALKGGLFSSIAVGIKDKHVRLVCGVYRTEKEAAIARDVVYWSFSDFNEKYARFLNYPEEVSPTDRVLLRERANHIIANGEFIHPLKTRFHGVLRDEESEGRFICVVHTHNAYFDVIKRGIKIDVQAAILHDKIQFMLGRSDNINFPDRLATYNRDAVIALYKRLTGRKKVRNNDFLGIFGPKKGSYTFRIFIRKGDAFSTGGFLTREQARRARDVYLLIRFNRSNDVYDKSILTEPIDQVRAEYEGLEVARESRKKAQAKVSRFYGVKKRGDYDAWVSNVYINGKVVSRTFKSELEAAKDYDARALANDPSCTRLNFPEACKAAA